MPELSIYVDDKIFNKYPSTAIGFLQVSNLDNILSSVLPIETFNEAKDNIKNNCLTLQNLAENPTIKTWRNLYQDCGVKPKSYKSSLESLVRRFIKEKYKKINPLVDLYNYISISSLLPMGGYDIEKIKGNLVLRYADDKDSFVALDGSELPLSSRQIVYADDESIICWMWNHRDSIKTRLEESTLSGLFIIDSILIEEKPRLHFALNKLEKNFANLGARTVKSGIIDKDSRHISLTY